MVFYLPVFLSAFLLGLAQHPLGLGWLAWFSLIPLLHSLHKAELLQTHLFMGFMWGLIYNLTSIYWLAFNIGTTFPVGFISMLGAVLYLSLYSIIISGIFYYIRKFIRFHPLYTLPFIWVSVEYYLSFGSLAFPWISLANTQINFLPLLQNAEYTGIYGISFWLVLVNILGYEVWRASNSRKFYKWVVIFLFPWITGLWIMPDYGHSSKGLLDVVVVQPNVHLTEKRRPGAVFANINNLLGMSLENLEDETDLIIWPETSTLSYLLQNGTHHLNFIKQALSQTNASLLTGLPFYIKEAQNNYRFYNSVAHIEKDTTENIYHKLHLVPMAEYIPLSPIFPELKKLNLGQANFEHGSEYTIFKVGEYNVASMVCFESTFPQMHRQFVQNGAEVFVYVVNDGWYETAPEPQQHAKQSVYRAIEYRRPVIRCANTGISQIIDTRGNITHQLDLNQKGVIQASVIPSSEMTFYAIYGDLFAMLNALIVFTLLGLTFRRNR